MEEIAEIVREIGRQQGENAYYRACYYYLKQLQDSVSQASDDLCQFYQETTFNPSCDIWLAHQVAENLRWSVYILAEQERKAQLALMELYNLENGA
jgi:nitrate/nitrite-specific signal transduction histidine kinase